MDEPPITFIAQMKGLLHPIALNVVGVKIRLEA